MPAPVLSSVSPSSGPPGTAITCVGSGFAAASQVGCPVLVATTYVDAGTLTAEIPSDLVGAEGTSLALAVFVRNEDGQASGVVPFTVLFPAVDLQSWTTVAAVAGEIAGFARGGKVKDAQILTWIRSVAQSIAGAMLRRGLSTDPATWQQPGTAGGPAPVGVLEMVNRLGAAARLAAAIAGQFGTAEWGLTKDLKAAFTREMTALQNGDYDKLFRPGAATVESGPLLAAGDMTDAAGNPTVAFTKERVF